MADRIEIFIGNVIHCPKPLQIECFSKGFVIVENGIIKAIGAYEDLHSIKKQLNIPSFCEEYDLTETQILIPGLIDTHIHGPQYPNAGLGYQKQLLEWLIEYTFPLEKKYEDVEYAKKVYKKVVHDSLSYGTTTACYFGTIHMESTIELANACILAGQRAFVGKVNMTNPEPEDLSEDPDVSLADTEKFVKAVLARESELVKPVITPRFALSCDETVMTKLGQLAEKYKVNIQSHISENKDECKAVLMKYCKDYTCVYDDCHLLTPRTVLAHGIHLEPQELALLAQKGTAIAHCPTSNFYLQSGNCNVRELLEAGVCVGLGTDISGGHTPSIMEVMRSAIVNSIQISYANVNTKPLTYSEVFYLATLGGAKALAIDNKVGNFKKGKSFDAVIVDLGIHPCNVNLLEKFTAKHLLQKFVYMADDRNIVKVFVAGRQVK